MKGVREVKKQSWNDMRHNFIFTVLRHRGKVMWRDASLKLQWMM